MEAQSASFEERMHAEMDATHALLSMATNLPWSQFEEKYLGNGESLGDIEIIKPVRRTNANFLPNMLIFNILPTGNENSENNRQSRVEKPTDCVVNSREIGNAHRCKTSPNVYRNLKRKYFITSTPIRSKSVIVAPNNSSPFSSDQLIQSPLNSRDSDSNDQPSACVGVASGIPAEKRIRIIASEILVPALKRASIEDFEFKKPADPKPLNKSTSSGRAVKTPKRFATSEENELKVEKTNESKAGGKRKPKKVAPKKAKPKKVARKVIVLDKAARKARRKAAKKAAKRRARRIARRAAKKAEMEKAARKKAAARRAAAKKIRNPPIKVETTISTRPSDLFCIPVEKGLGRQNVRFTRKSDWFMKIINKVHTNTFDVEHRSIEGLFIYCKQMKRGYKMVKKQGFLKVGGKFEQLKNKLHQLNEQDIDIGEEFDKEFAYPDKELWKSMVADDQRVEQLEGYKIARSENNTKLEELLRLFDKIDCKFFIPAHRLITENKKQRNMAKSGFQVAKKSLHAQLIIKMMSLIPKLPDVRRKFYWTHLRGKLMEMKAKATKGKEIKPKTPRNNGAAAKSRKANKTK